MNITFDEMDPQFTEKMTIYELNLQLLNCELNAAQSKRARDEVWAKAYLASDEKTATGKKAEADLASAGEQEAHDFDLAFCATLRHLVLYKRCADHRDRSED